MYSNINTINHAMSKPPGGIMFAIAETTNQAVYAFFSIKYKGK